MARATVRSDSDKASGKFELVPLSGQKIRDRLAAADLLKEDGHAIVGYPKFDIPPSKPPRLFPKDSADRAVQSAPFASPVVLVPDGAAYPRLVREERSIHPDLCPACDAVQEAPDRVAVPLCTRLETPARAPNTRP